MRSRGLSILLIFGVYFFSAFQTCVLAEPPDTPKSQSTEERLAAIEGKLQQLENRLDQALGISSLKPGATGVPAEAAVGNSHQ